MRNGVRGDKGSRHPYCQVTQPPRWDDHANTPLGVNGVSTRKFKRDCRRLTPDV